MTYTGNNLVCVFGGGGGRAVCVAVCKTQEWPGRLFHVFFFISGYWYSQYDQFYQQRMSVSTVQDGVVTEELVSCEALVCICIHQLSTNISSAKIDWSTLKLCQIVRQVSKVFLPMPSSTQIVLVSGMELNRLLYVLITLFLCYSFL